jgi:integrase
MARGAKPAKVKGIYERDDWGWCARYRVNGKLIRKQFGHGPAARQEAIDWLTKVRYVKTVEGGVSLPKTVKAPVQTRQERKDAEQERTDSVLVSELVEDLREYIRSHPSQYKDQRNVGYRLDRINRGIGDKPAATLKPKELEAWLDSLTFERKGKKFGQPLADASVNRIRVMVSSAYKRGIHNEKVTVNPVKATPQRKVRNGVVRWLHDDEEARIRAALQARIAKAEAEERYDHANRQRHHLCEFVIALHSGMRKGEQYGLVWPEVETKSRHIHVKESKNGTERYIPMSKEALASFRTLKFMALTRKDRAEGTPNPAPEDSVFALGDPKKWWKEVLAEAKVKSFRWHDLRHTFCSRLVMAGRGLKVVQELAGHRDIKMTARYAHLDHRSKLSAIESVFDNPASELKEVA